MKKNINCLKCDNIILNSQKEIREIIINYNNDNDKYNLLKIENSNENNYEIDKTLDIKKNPYILNDCTYFKINCIKCKNEIGFDLKTLNFKINKKLKQGFYLIKDNIVSTKKFKIINLDVNDEENESEEENEADNYLITKENINDLLNNMYDLKDICNILKKKVIENTDKVKILNDTIDKLSE